MRVGEIEDDRLVGSRVEQRPNTARLGRQSARQLRQLLCRQPVVLPVQSLRHHLDAAQRGAKLVVTLVERFHVRQTNWPCRVHSLIPLMKSECSMECLSGG